MDRPKRALPTRWAIAAYWRDRLDIEWKGHIIGWGEPFCFRCGWLSPPIEVDTASAAWRETRNTLDRAHLVDRCFGGLDIEPNLVMLCALCHAEMPSFTDGGDALAWVQNGRHRSHAWQVVTDTYYAEWGEVPKPATVKRLWRLYLEDKAGVLTL